jgi:hypothetical protein
VQLPRELAGQIEPAKRDDEGEERAGQDRRERMVAS